MGKALGLAALLLIGGTVPAPAQWLDELRPLRAVIGDGEAPVSYIATRCAAFFVATSEVLGDQIDPDMARQVDGIVTLFLTTAVGAMEADGQDRQAAQAAAEAEVIDLTAAYSARFAANIAAGNPAFAEDPVYLADNEDCLAVLAGE